MKVTTRMRLDAILICDLFASLPDQERTEKVYHHHVRQVGDVTPGALLLAERAWNAAYRHDGGLEGGTWRRSVDAEAAQLLREGWTP